MPIKKNDIWENLMVIANECYSKGIDYNEIHKILLNTHDDEAMVYAVIKKLKSEHYAEKAKEGRKFLLIGFLLIIVGFIITCINFHSNQSIAFAMYGLTTAGLVFVFYGLYKIIG
ncbi:MAG: hypothetical protein JNJ41_10960 [Bacteroidia bacterium]|nr:hypothetical protein [Bacteroidia bacterium]